MDDDVASLSRFAAAAFTAATAAKADKQARGLTSLQTEQLQDAARNYDAAGWHAEAAASEIQAFASKLTLADQAYRGFKNMADTS